MVKSSTMKMVSKILNIGLPEETYQKFSNYRQTTTKAYDQRKLAPIPLGITVQSLQTFTSRAFSYNKLLPQLTLIKDNKMFTKSYRNYINNPKDLPDMKSTKTSTTCPEMSNTTLYHIKTHCIVHHSTVPHCIVHHSTSQNCTVHIF